MNRQNEENGAVSYHQLHHSEFFFEENPDKPDFKKFLDKKNLKWYPHFEPFMKGTVCQPSRSLA